MARSIVQMNRLRLVAPPGPNVSHDDACLEAFRQEFDYVMRTLRRLGAAPSDLEDLAQELFLALRRAWGQYDPERPLRPYLFGIAFRLTSAHRRKRDREVLFGAVELNDTSPGPDDALHSKQARALILAVLERIPLKRRAIFIMHDIDEIPVTEVAEALSIPRFTVYSRLRKARREFEASARLLRKDVG